MSGLHKLQQSGSRYAAIKKEAQKALAALTEIKAEHGDRDSDLLAVAKAENALNAIEDLLGKGGV